MTPLNPDLSKPTCRVCLQNNEDEMASIFDLDTDFEDDLLIYEKIEQCADIKIVQHDKIPTLICGDCYGILKVSYKFRTICRNSDDYLKEVFSDIISLSEKKKKPSTRKNPLSIEEKVTEKKTTRSQYKKRQKEKELSPQVENIKSEEELEEDKLMTQIIKIEQVIGPRSPTNSNEEINDKSVEDFVNNEGDDDMWFQPEDHEDDLDFSIESLDLDIKEENDEDFLVAKKPAKSKKKLAAKAKKAKATKPSKTLGISADGEAIIREKKPRAKREKKEKPEKQPHICDVCGNIYQRRYALEVHMKRHSDEKPYECEICGHAFYSNFELIRHMRTHTGSRPYKCSYCPRAFGDQSTLIKHERIHRNERPFKCETCGKSFTYSNVLKHHIYTHTGEKPYSCELCGKAFTHSHHLRAHLETLQHQNDPRAKILLEKSRKVKDYQEIKMKNDLIKKAVNEMITS